VLLRNSLEQIHAPHPIWLREVNQQRTLVELLRELDRK
jgi:hypothetical protein